MASPLSQTFYHLVRHQKEDLLACAAGIEIFSEHPLAQSIVEAAKNEKITLHNATNFQKRCR